MIVTFSGNDGSGKSFLAKQFLKDCEKNMPVLHLKEFDYFILNILKKKKNKYISTKKQEKKSKTLLLLPYLIFLDLLIEYFYYSFFHSKKVIVKERSTLDFLATWEELNISNTFIRYIYKNIISYDISFLINTSPEIAQERRIKQVKEGKKIYSKNKLNDSNFFIMKSEIYQSLKKSFPVLEINNNDTPKDSLKKIHQIFNIKNNIQNKNISISGLDGAGKSTAINLLKADLEKLNIKVKTLHFYYNYIPIKFFNYIKKVLKKDKKINEKVQHKKSIEHEKKAVKKTKGIFWVAYVICDAWIQYLWVKIFYPRHLIIFDRFFYDYLVSFNFLGVKYNKKFLIKFFPNIDKNFILLAPPEVLYKRKPEHTKEFFKSCHSQYEEVVKQFNIDLVDTEKNTPQEVVDILIHKISQ